MVSTYEQPLLLPTLKRSQFLTVLFSLRWQKTTFRSRGARGCKQAIHVKCCIHFSCNQKRFTLCRMYTFSRDVFLLDKDTVNLKKLMIFITGSSLMPKDKISVTFSKSDSLVPDPDCCFARIELPTAHPDFNSFAKSMNGAISCQYMGTGRC